MSKNIKNKVIAGVVGFGIVLTPTVAFADSAVVGTTTTVVAPATTPAPVSTSKPTDANKATHKAAVEAYRVALKAWQDTRKANQVAYEATSVDLPQPEGPTITMNSPSLMSALTQWMTWCRFALAVAFDDVFDGDGGHVSLLFFRISRLG